MAIKELKDINKRPRYFAGQYLLEDDFELEQDYARDRLQRYTRSLHVSGIADGLIASKPNDPTLKLAVDISAGTAIDRQGRQVVLLESRQVDLSKDLVETVKLDDGSYILSIRYDEQETEPQDGNTSTNRRILENPAFKLSSSAASDDFMAISKLTIKDGIVSIADDSNSVRKYTGWRLPGSSNNPLTLRSEGDRASNLAVLSGSLSVTDKVGIGTTDPKQQLVVNSGKASIGYNDAQQTAALAVNGNVGIGTTDPGTSKLKIVNSASDFADISFSGSGMGQLQMVGWSSGWNINAITPGKHLYLNRDSSGNSDVYIGCKDKELFVRGSDGSVGIGLKDNRANYLNPASSVGTNSSLVVASKTKNLLAVGQNFDLAKTESVLTFVRDGVSGQSWSNIVDFRIGRYEKSDNASRTQLDILLAHRDLEKGFPLPNPPVETKLEQIMTLRSNGNVGIGTTQPGDKLSIQGGALSFHNPSNPVPYVGLDYDSKTDALRIRGNINATVLNTDHVTIDRKTGNVGIGIPPCPTKNYTIDLIGSAFESTEGDANTSLKVDNVSMNMQIGRGLNTVILDSNGAYKDSLTHDVYANGNPSQWNTWATWVNTKAQNGDIVAVGSRDAIYAVPTEGEARALLRSIGAIDPMLAFDRLFQQLSRGSILPTDVTRRPYALLFIKGRIGAMEVLQPYKGANARLSTSYDSLLKFTYNPNPTTKLDVSGILRTQKLQLGNKFLLSGDRDGVVNDEWLRLMQPASPEKYYGGFAAGKLHSAEGVLNGSDARMKKDIRNLSKVLDKVLSLRGVSFQWKDSKQETLPRLGMIAQEVETLFPELVEMGPNNMRAINYSGFIAILIEAIKEQQQQIEKLSLQISE
jgi:Chaperone of endosialidase